MGQTKLRHYVDSDVIINKHKCDATCQNQILLAMGFGVIVLFNKRLSLAFICYFIHVSRLQ